MPACASGFFSQSVHSGELHSLFLYSAHLDVRPLNPRPSVRVFAVLGKPEMPDEARPYCQLWVEGMQDPFPVRAENFTFTGWEGLWNK